MINVRDKEYQEKAKEGLMKYCESLGYTMLYATILGSHSIGVAMPSSDIDVYILVKVNDEGYYKENKRFERINAYIELEGISIKHDVHIREIKETLKEYSYGALYALDALLAGVSIYRDLTIHEQALAFYDKEYYKQSVKRVYDTHYADDDLTTLHVKELMNLIKYISIYKLLDTIGEYRNCKIEELFTNENDDGIILSIIEKHQITRNYQITKDDEVVLKQYIERLFETLNDVDMKDKKEKLNKFIEQI